MNRADFENYINETYNADSDCPWDSSPKNRVFRHVGSRKWFALVMDLPKATLGLKEKGTISVVNLKCSPILIGSLLTESGYFPAYHMSKSTWITVALDGTAPDDEIKMLLELSFDATAKKPQGKGSLARPRAF